MISKLRVKSFFCMIILLVLILSVCNAPVQVNNMNSKITDTSKNTPIVTEMKNFLKKNYSNVDLSKTNVISDLNILDEDAKRYDVFLSGEGHAISINYNLKLAFVKYLSEKANVKYLLAEMGYSMSCYINRYLQTGNEEILKFIYRDLKGTAAFSKDDYNFWISLRKYNTSLPENKKIIVIGIDIEHRVNTACIYLSSILPNKDAPSSIKIKFDQFKSDISNIKYSDHVNQSVLDFQNDIKNNKSIYKDYLGDSFFEFNMIVDNIINSIDASKSSSPIGDIREKNIYKNFISIYDHLPKGKYFGQFGMAHIIQQPYESFFSFATYLNQKNSPIKNKVLSIAYNYENCYRMDGNNQVLANSYLIDNCVIDGYSNTNVTLFKLTGAHSPFNKQSYFVDSRIIGGVSNCYQYIALIKNAKAATPYDSIK